MANMRYLPSKGTTREVGGMISTTSKKNTYSDVRMEMDRVTWEHSSAQGRLVVVASLHPCISGITAMPVP